MTMARLAAERGARDVFDTFFTYKGVREDWERYINLDDLEMWHPSRCIIGQMSPVISEPEDKEDYGYGTALKALDRAFGTNVSEDDEEYETWSHHHGFEAGPGFFTFEDLRRAWRDEIQGRLEKLNHG